MKFSESTSILPIKPYSYPQAEILFPIACNFFFSKLLGIKSVLPLNTIGFHKNSTDKTTFISIIRKLGIDSFLWDEAEYINLIQKFIDIGELKRLLEIKRSIILRCGCGRTEIEESNVDYIWGRKRTFEKNECGLLCKVCRGKLFKEETDSLFINFSKVAFAEKQRILPHNFYEPFIAHRKELAVPTLRISRLRKENPKISALGREFHIDADFTWPIFAYSVFSVHGVCVKYVVSTHGTLKQLALFSLVSEVLDFADVTFLILPTIHFINERNDLVLSLADMMAEYCPEAVRTFLLTGLCWGRKESKIKSGVLYRTNLVFGKHKGNIGKKNTESLKLNIEELLHINGNIIQSIIAKLNKGIKLECGEERILKCLF